MFKTSEKNKTFSVSSASDNVLQKNGIVLAQDLDGLSPMQIGLLGYALPNYDKSEAVSFLLSRPEYFRFIVCPQDIQIELVKRDSSYIRHIENPSEIVQLSALEKDPSAIRYISNPTQTIMKKFRGEMQELADKARLFKSVSSINNASCAPCVKNVQIIN